MGSVTSSVADCNTTAEFTVDGVSDIIWNNVPFDALVLPSVSNNSKRCLLSLKTFGNSVSDEQIFYSCFT